MGEEKAKIAKIEAKCLTSDPTDRQNREPRPVPKSHFDAKMIYFPGPQTAASRATDRKQVTSSAFQRSRPHFQELPTDFTRDNSKLPPQSEPQLITKGDQRPGVRLDRGRQPGVDELVIHDDLQPADIERELPAHRALRHESEVELLLARAPGPGRHLREHAPLQIGPHPGHAQELELAAQRRHVSPLIDRQQVLEPIGLVKTEGRSAELEQDRVFKSRHPKRMALISLAQRDLVSILPG